MCTISLHSKLYKIILLVWMYKDNMDGLSGTNYSALVATPGSVLHVHGSKQCLDLFHLSEEKKESEKD